MTNPNEPFESRPENLSETTNPSPATSSQPINNEQFNQVQQQASNIFNEIIDDISNKKDLDVIIGVVACILALLFLLLQITRSISFSTIRLFFILSIFTPALSGWALRAGYGTVGQQRVKLYVLGGFAFGIYLISVF